MKLSLFGNCNHRRMVLLSCYVIACGSGAALAVAQEASGDKPAANTPAAAEVGGA
jgi:hypothetical protein